MIELRDVHLRLAGKKVLQGVNLHFEEGDRMVVLGASGVGKSTILRVILGLLRPERGQVLWNGDDIRRLDESELIERRKGLAIVFQGGALFDNLTVGENVGYRLFEEGRLPVDQIEERVREHLRSVELEEAIDLYPAQLSGGMRKRAAIARAMAAAPRCILFDEPTAGLDPLGACRVNRLIVECQKRGKGTLVVTHDLDCAFRVGRRLLFIHDGRVAFEGGRDEMEQSRFAPLREFLSPHEKSRATAEEGA